MFRKRLLELPKNHSFFLFGPRGVGKSTLVKKQFDHMNLAILRTKDDVEVDLVVERPGQKLLFIEIKSSSHITKEAISSFWHITKDFEDREAICFSKDPLEKKWDHVRAIFWLDGIKRYFGQSK